MSEQEEDKIIAKGFNAGYTLSQFEPKVLEGILKANNKDNAYFQAMAKGKQQHEREKIIEQQQRIQEKQQTKKRGR